MRAGGPGQGGLPEAVQEAAERASEVVDEREFYERVGKLVQESGDLLEPEVAAFAVLDELGVGEEPPMVAPEYAKILAPEALEAGLDGVIVEGTLLGMEPTRTFDKDDGSTGFVTDARIKGEQGVYEVTMWDEHIRALVGVDPGTPVRLDGLYTKEHRGQVELHTGRDARVRVLNEDELDGDEDDAGEDADVSTDG